MLKLRDRQIQQIDRGFAQGDALYLLGGQPAHDDTIGRAQIQDVQPLAALGSLDQCQLGPGDQMGPNGRLGPGESIQGSRLQLGTRGDVFGDRGRAGDIPNRRRVDLLLAEGRHGLLMEGIERHGLFQKTCFLVLIQGDLGGQKVGLRGGRLQGFTQEIACSRNSEAVDCETNVIEEIGHRWDPRA